MRSQEEKEIAEEEMKQKIKEWLQKEFKPEEVKKLDKYIPLMKDEIKKIEKVRQRFDKIEFILDFLAIAISTLILYLLQKFFPLFLLFLGKSAPWFFLPLYLLTDIGLDYIVLRERRSTLLIKKLPLLFFYFGANFKFKNDNNTRLEYSNRLNLLLGAFNLWLKQEPYRYVSPELNKLRIQLRRLEKIIYLTPPEEFKKWEVPKKFLELTLSLEEGNIPRLYSLIQEFESIKKEIKYEYVPFKEKIAGLLKEYQTFIIGIIMAIITLISMFLGLQIGK